MVKWVCVPSQGYNYKQCKFVAKGQHDDFHLEMFLGSVVKANDLCRYWEIPY